MKRRLTAMKYFYILLVLMVTNIVAGNEFEKWFEDATMRIDYFHFGDSRQDDIAIDRIYRYDTWPGRHSRLIDSYGNGLYRVTIRDAENGEVIYSQGFSSFFGEYQSTAPAAQGVKRAFHETCRVPWPKYPVIFSLDKRDGKNEFRQYFQFLIDPGDISIIRQMTGDPQVKIIKNRESGPPAKKVDIAFIAEGYTIEEFSKFKKDLSYFSNVLMNSEPYRSMADQFNIYGVFKASVESGVDEPRAGIYKQTALNVTFNSLGSERYLMTEDNKALQDIAGHVPFDALVIMVNHSRYGGGGIYNQFCVFTTGNQWKEYLLLHEFGHSFAGLADEYYTSSTAYSELNTPTIEPFEPNITALHDKKIIKWKSFLTPGVQMPTPWKKKGFDKMDYAWQSERARMNNQIAELKRKHAATNDIIEAEREYDRRDAGHTRKVDEYFLQSRFFGVVGAFEGAGYMQYGLYRPMLDCLMFSKGKKPFCVVCENVVKQVINGYTN